MAEARKQKPSLEFQWWLVLIVCTLGFCVYAFREISENRWFPDDDDEFVDKQKQTKCVYFDPVQQPQGIELPPVPLPKPPTPELADKFPAGR